MTLCITSTSLFYHRCLSLNVVYVPTYSLLHHDDDVDDDNDDNDDDGMLKGVAGGN